jgi:pullulanase/glycogen debranching enzyme
MLLASTGENHEVRSYRYSCSIDDALLLIFNASNEDKSFALPALNGVWQKILDTGSKKSSTPPESLDKTLTLQAKSFAVLSYIHKATTPLENA